MLDVTNGHVFSNVFFISNLNKKVQAIYKKSDIVVIPCESSNMTIPRTWTGIINGLLITDDPNSIF